MSVTDDQLMCLFQEGDVLAFSKIVDRYHDFLVRFFRVRGRTEAEAADLAQDVWKKVFKARHEYSAKAPFRAYLARIARNHLIDLTRGADFRHAPISLDGRSDGNDERKGGLQDVLCAPDVDPAHDAMSEELCERIKEALMSLPEPQRETFILCRLEDMKYEDAAEVLGVPVGTIKSRVFNAIRHLRDMLRAEVT